MNEKIVDCICQTIREINEELEIPQLNDPTAETRLYGARSGMDSIGLVTLIAELEVKVSEAFDRDIVLADERAMSQLHSPFRQVKTLAEYIEQIFSSDEA